MDTGMRFNFPNPLHMGHSGIWIHRDIRCIEHVADARCWCSPMFVSAYEMDHGGPCPRKIAAFNWIH